MNELLWSICILCLTTLGLMFLLKRLNQPYMIAYIIAGVVLGPHVSGVFTNPEEIETIGEVGILLLMFFLGMEINVPDNRTLLIKPIIAQSMKIILSFICAALIGNIIGLSLNSMVLIAVLFIFNSTAIVSEVLSKHNTLKTPFGTTILNILIFQDLLFAPVLTVLKAWNKEGFKLIHIVFPVMVCFAVFLFKRIRIYRKSRSPNYSGLLKKITTCRYFLDYSSASDSD